MLEENFKEKVLSALNRVRPTLQFDGGDVELVEVDEKEKTVTIRLKGACVGCMGAWATLEYGVKDAIVKSAPEVKEVKALF